MELGGEGRNEGCEFGHVAPVVLPAKSSDKGAFINDVTQI